MRRPVPVAIAVFSPGLVQAVTPTTDELLTAQMIGESLLGRTQRGEELLAEDRPRVRRLSSSP